MYILKILVYFLAPEGLNSMLESFGLPISNEKFQILILQLNEITTSFFLVSLLLCAVFVFYAVRFLNIQDTIKD